MKRLTRTVLAVLLAGAVLGFIVPIALAGRAGGPMSTTVYVPPGQSVYFDVPFNSGTAAVSISGPNETLMQIYLYDSDGHVATGAGPVDQKTATMNVYRPGVFRVEIQNFSVLPNTVTFSTN